MTDLTQDLREQPARIDGVFMATYLHEVRDFLLMSSRLGSHRIHGEDRADLLAATEAILRGEHGVL